MSPPVVCITDCADTNARARLSVRIAALFGATPVVLPVTGRDPQLPAGLTLLDTLLATGMLGCAGYPTITLVNIAPRDGEWPNGAPFCYFRHRGHLVVSTFSQCLLRFVHRYLGISQVSVTAVREVLEAAARGWATFCQQEVDAIDGTQFRSLWYQPLLAKWVAEGRALPAHAAVLTSPADEGPAVVALVDNFGNCKLDRPGDLLGLIPGGYQKVLTYRAGHVSGVREVRCYRTLAEVPREQPGLITGSSGTGFAELVVGCGSAAAEFGLTAGDQVLRQ